jgi:pimeloyl-ACP methyl ester carboxylesterase
MNPPDENMEFIRREVGVLILNGAPPSRATAIALADALRNSGLNVVLPEPNDSPHEWKELNFERWSEWLEISNNSLLELKEKCATVFITGLDAASTIALKLAQIHGDGIDGLILVDPTLPTNHLRLRKIWKAVDQGLPLVDQPLIMMYSTRAELDYSENAITISNNISSPFIREVVLEDSSTDFPTIVEEASLFINEVTQGFWLTDIATDDDSELIDAEFASIVAGLALDESTPANFLDDLDRQIPVENEEHFENPDPVLEPIRDPMRKNAIIAMILGPIYAFAAAITGFDPFGIEPWPGILAFIGGLLFFFYSLQDYFDDDDGAKL